jgi:serine/threonine protein phosphatase PrpC
MKISFAGQVPKDLSFPESMEDAIAIDPDLTTVAVSDGASESFDSKTWANILVKRYAEVPSLSAEWIDEAIASYASQHDTETLSWSKLAAFERGSFATLLGITQSLPREELEIIAVGDSIAVLLSNGEFIESFPYRTYQEFQQRPELLCTISKHNEIVKSVEFLEQHAKIWELMAVQAPTILCMTDALGEWALRNAAEGTPKWDLLNSVNTQEELDNLVLHGREYQNMHLDDVTLIRIDPTLAERDDLSNA